MAALSCDGNYYASLILEQYVYTHQYLEDLVCQLVEFPEV